MLAYLIDTNILIDHLREYKSILSFIKECLVKNYRLKISVITRAEIKAGQSMKEPKQAKKAELLLSIFDVVCLDSLIADKAGNLKRKYSINIIDAIIAATALITNSVLLTRNTKHFKDISNLKIKSIL